MELDDITAAAPTPIEFQSRLTDYKPETIENWQQWLQLWDTSPAEVRLGLLHVGFDMHLHRADESAFDRVRFYLEVADGHNGPILNPDGGFHVEWRGRLVPVSEVRVHLAQKAFDVLCQRLFKLPETHSDRELRDHFRHLINRMPGLIEALIWFWRLYAGGPRNFLGRRGHSAQMQMNFARELVKFIFAVRHDDELPDRVMVLRPRLVHVLVYLDLTELLLDYQWRPDDATKAALLRLATYRHLEESMTLEEAYAGRRATSQQSSVAKVLLLLDIKEKQEARQKAIRQAEQQQAEAEARLAELRGNGLERHCPNCQAVLVPEEVGPGFRCPNGHGLF